MSRLEIHIAFRYREGGGVACSWAETLEPGSIIAWLGASGSGKTTLLRCLAGLERPQRGQITFNGEAWFDTERNIDVPPEQRRVGVLFQDYALFPHLSVAQNITFGAPSGNMHRIAEVMEMLRLTGFERRLPRDLSGGQQQRVALARALCREPQLLLLDEPLSALDTPTRDELRYELGTMIRESRIPACIITHDRLDALTLADRTLLFDQGAIVQSGPTREIFAEPQTPAAAKLVGVDTVLPGAITSMNDGMAHVDVKGHDVFVAAPSGTSGAVVLCIRAEDVTLARHASNDVSATNQWRAVIADHRLEGPFIRVSLDCGFRLAALVTREAWSRLALSSGDVVVAIVKATAIQALPRT
jgi:molybdate transport system ATP-binding protein